MTPHGPGAHALLTEAPVVVTDPTLGRTGTPGRPVRRLTVTPGGPPAPRRFLVSRPAAPARLTGTPPRPGGRHPEPGNSSPEVLVAVLALIAVMALWAVLRATGLVHTDGLVLSAHSVAHARALTALIGVPMPALFVLLGLTTDQDHALGLSWRRRHASALGVALLAVVGALLGTAVCCWFGPGTGPGTDATEMALRVLPWSAAGAVVASLVVFPLLHRTGLWDLPPVTGHVPWASRRAFRRASRREARMRAVAHDPALFDEKANRTTRRPCPAPARPDPTPEHQETP